MTALWIAPLSYATSALCALAALPVLVLLAQVLLAHGTRRARAAAPPRTDSAALAVLITAHNEAVGIGGTLR